MLKFIRHIPGPLLLLATMVLVMNPLWHAIGHSYSVHAGQHSSHPLDTSGSDSSTSWSEVDQCVFCEGTIHFTEASYFDVSVRHVVVNEKPLSSNAVLHGQHLSLNVRLRAPPHHLV